MLNFFATWCAPCRAEMPELTRFATKFKEQPFTLIGIDAHEEPALVDDFVKKVGVGFPVGIDEGPIAQRYGVISYPTTVIIGADGRVLLYETTAIMNADVALHVPVEAELTRLREGAGVSREAYLAALESESFAEVAPRADHEDTGLTGRAKEIASGMPCVCGCDDMLLDCTCKVAKGMREKVRELSLDESRTDVAIMEAVNAEFCMREM